MRKHTLDILLRLPIAPPPLQHIRAQSLLRNVRRHLPRCSGLPGPVPQVALRGAPAAATRVDVALHWTSEHTSVYDERKQ